MCIEAELIDKTKCLYCDAIPGFGRTWQKRRVIITKELLVLAHIDQDVELDRVVLSEVDFVKEFMGFGDGDEKALNTDQNTRTVQIATDLHGFNSGRTYYFRTDSDEFDEIVKSCVLLARSAKRRAEARTVFAKIQREVRGLYDSRIFQILIASVIAAVSCVFKILAS